MKLCKPLSLSSEGQGPWRFPETAQPMNGIQICSPEEAAEEELLAAQEAARLEATGSVVVVEGKQQQLPRSSESFVHVHSLYPTVTDNH